MKSSSRLWTPGESASPGLRGDVSITVHDRKGTIIQHEEGPNTVLPYLLYMQWSSLVNVGERYYDGALYYPSWEDIYANIDTTGSSAAIGAAPLNSALTGFFFVGAYSGAAPSGNVSYFLSSDWTTYYGQASNVWQAAPLWTDYNSVGATPSAQAITSTLTSSQYSLTLSGAGSFNAIALLPQVSNQTGSVAVYPAGPTSDYLAALGQTNSSDAQPSTSQLWDGAIASGLNIVASTFYLAPSTVTVPSGGSATISYSLSVTL